MSRSQNFTSSIQSQLPQLPTLADLGLSPQQLRGSSQQDSQVSDGSKKVNYNAIRPRNVRPFQSSPIRQAPPSRAPNQGQVQWMQKKVYPDLKITPHGEAIAKFIEQLPVFAIDAPTGTGKTLYIPYLMAIRGHIVRVAVPTTIAVRDAYQFQMKHSILRVGYAAGREIHYSDDDQLVYATTGHFTQRIIGMIKNNQQDQIRRVLGDILFVDEVHTSTSQITLLIGLARHLYTDATGKYNGPKIIFSTATFNHGDVIDHFPEFPVYKIDIEAMPITDIFMTKPRNPIKDDPNSEIERIIREELVRWHNLPPIGKKYHGIVFRPGLQEVEDTIKYLEKKFPISEPLEFYPAYSHLSPTEIDEIFKPSEKMKIIVGTNIIESSITIEDAGFVIDDMTEKIAETSSTGGNKLTLAIISKAARQQRRGRIGRTIIGRAYALITEIDFASLPPFRLREIDRIPIYDIVLQLIDAGLSPRDILKISISRYDQARRILIQFGMIENRADRYFVTDAGRFVSTIPLSVQNAYMIYLAYNRFVQRYTRPNADLPAERILLRTIIAVASMIESYGPSYMFTPRRARDEDQTEYIARKNAHIEKYHEKFRGLTDIHTFVNIFWIMMSDFLVTKTYDQATRYAFTNYLRDWSRDNSMNNKKLREFWTVMRDVESVVESKLKDESPLRSEIPQSGIYLGRDLPDGGFDILGTVTAEIFVQAYAINRFVRNIDFRGTIGYLDKQTGIIYKINQNTAFSQIVVNDFVGPTEIVAGQTVEMVGKKGGKVNLAGLIVSSDYFPPSMRVQIPEEKLE